MKLYISPCPNDTFMFDAIVNRRIPMRGFDFEVEYHDIEQLNSRAMRGEAHISKISCAVLPKIADRYVVSDSGAALGRGNGPLFVRRRGDRSPFKEVAVPGVHTTANLLISRLFPEFESRREVLFSEVATAVESGEFDAGVLIHEGRFLYEERNLELIADLGLEWERKTSMPLPLGAIVMSREIDEERRREFELLLRESIEYAFANPHISRGYIKEHAQEMADDVIEKHIALFVNDYSRSLGEEGRRAIELLIG